MTGFLPPTCWSVVTLSISVPANPLVPAADSTDRQAPASDPLIVPWRPGFIEILLEKHFSTLP